MGATGPAAQDAGVLALLAVAGAVVSTVLLRKVSDRARLRAEYDLV